MKGRDAEYEALTELDGAAMAAVTALVQLWPGSAVGAAREQPSMWPAEEADEVFRRLQAGLLKPLADRDNGVRELLLDGEWMDPESFGEVVERCCSLGLRPVPVTGLRRDGRYQAITANAIDRCGTGAVLRLGRDDFLATQTALAERIDAFLEVVRLTPASVDIVLDLRWIARETWEADAIWARSAVLALPHVGEWRNVATAATGTPANAAGLPQKAIETRPRIEWWLWKTLGEERGRLPRLPVFGDYGAVHPDRVEEGINPKFGKRIPLLRYATGEEELLLRGTDLDKEPSHLPELLKDLIAERTASPEGFDASFSAGDAWIANTDERIAHPGNRAIWKFVGQNRHIAFVSWQLANLAGT
jgi:hypothetical protein